MLRTLVFLAAFQTAIALRIYQGKSKTFAEQTALSEKRACTMEFATADFGYYCVSPEFINGGVWPDNSGTSQYVLAHCLDDGDCLSAYCYYTADNINDDTMTCGGCLVLHPTTLYNSGTTCGTTASIAKARYATVVAGTSGAAPDTYSGCSTAFVKTCTSSSNGDPHVVNMGNKKFDIVALGTFSFVNYPQLARNHHTQLSIDGTVTRFGKGCHSTFVSEITLSGSWLTQRMIVRSPDSNGATPAELEMRNHTSEPWSAPTPVSNDFSSLTIPDKRSFLLKVQGVRVAITAHQYHQKGGSNKNWNFLNLDVSGLAKLPGDVGGLLSLEDHRDVTKGDKSCDSPKLTAGTGFNGPLSYIRGQ